ncbi:MAG: hypothetical protein RL299_2129 [Pseudomonadota bacterium]|jgi:hypothetical protein
MVDEVSVPRFVETSTFEADVAMLQNGWRPTGGPINIAANEGLLNWPLRALVNRTRWLWNAIADMRLRADLLVTVGTGGTFATINEALAYLSDRRPAYVSGGFTTELRLKTGFVMREQVIVKGINLSWIKITSEDAEVQIDRAYLTVASGGFYGAFCAEDGGFLPTIGVLFTMMATGTATSRCGIRLVAGGGASVLTGKGVKAAPIGVQMNTGAVLIANDAVFSGCTQYACVVHGGSVATLQAADLRNSGGAGIFVANASRVHAASALITGCVTGAITATFGSQININSASCRTGGSDAATDIVVGSGSIISATASTGGTNITINTITASGIIFK